MPCRDVVHLFWDELRLLTGPTRAACGDARAFNRFVTVAPASAAAGPRCSVRASLFGSAIVGTAWPLLVAAVVPVFVAVLVGVFVVSGTVDPAQPKTRRRLVVADSPARLCGRGLSADASASRDGPSLGLGLADAA